MPSQGESAHEFGALNTLLLVVVLGLCIISAYLIKQNSFYYLPESGAAILVGLVVGGLTRLVYPSKEELEFLSFDPQLFFFLLLPPIIFEAGYSLKKKEFFANFWTISLFAVGGTIMSTFIIGLLVYLVGLTGMIPVTNPLECLLYGALISAVDPVATLSIMGNAELNCDPLLYSLVFGESVLNDAVAIVLFNAFMKFYDSSKDFTANTIPSVMLSFTIISLGSIVVGIITALVCCYLCKQTQMKKYPEYEISILFLFAYGSYSFAESLELSGIMSLFFSSIILSYYNNFNLSATSQVTSHCIFKSLAVLCEFFVFLYMGMGLFTGRFKDWNFLFIFTSIIICLVSRLFNTFPFSFLANTFRSRPIPINMQIVLWFAGLRGAMSFALSMNMVGENRDLYITTTLSVVIFTTVICGGLTEPVLAKMGMKINSHDDSILLTGDNDLSCQYEVLVQALDGSLHSHDIDTTTTIASSSNSSNNNKSRTHPTSSLSSSSISTGEMQSFWQKFDTQFMKPYFGGSLTGATEPNNIFSLNHETEMNTTISDSTSSSLLYHVDNSDHETKLSGWIGGGTDINAKRRHFTEGGNRTPPPLSSISLN